MTLPRSVSTFVLAALIGLASLAGSATRAAAFSQAEAKAPMTVTLVRSDAKDCGTNCPEWIALTGKILPPTPALLKTALGRAGNKHIPILIDSPGGSVEAALAMGRMIRTRKLDVAVAGTALTDCASGDRACLLRARQGERTGYVAAGIAACASACVFILAAGTDRVVGHDSYVGVHQMIASRTLTRVINTFRILRRLVHGQVVEVSRTLIATRPVSSRVVTSAASTQTYSEVDRYLLGMGIDESIMPLMHATPPTGIHWMTPVELASTRIVTDTTDAQTLVAREAEAQAPTKTVTSAAEFSALTLDDGRRWLGAATWRIESSVSNAPRLTVDIAIPDRQLTGTLTFSRPTDPAVFAAFQGAVGFRQQQTGSAVTEMRPPQFCDLANCVMPLTADPSFHDADGPFAFNVPLAWDDTFLSSLRDRDWLELPVRTADGWGKVTVPLTGASGNVIAAWEHLCCGLAPSNAPRPAPNPPLPQRPVGSVAKLPPVASPAASAATVAPDPAWHAVDARAHFDFQMPDLDRSADGTALLSWVSLAPNPAGPAGVPVLLATTNVDSAKLSLSIEVAPAAPVSRSRLLFIFNPSVEDPSVFGPITMFSVSTLLSATGDPLLLPLWTRRIPNGTGYWLGADVPLAGEMPKQIEVEFDDARKRRLILVVPIDDEVATVLQAAARRSAAGGS